MDAEHLIQTCKWATPTLFLQWPLWLDAWSWPWSCAQSGHLRLISHSESCRICPFWELRQAGAVPPRFSAAGRIERD